MRASLLEQPSAEDKTVHVHCVGPLDPDPQDFSHGSVICDPDTKGKIKVQFVRPFLQNNINLLKYFFL